MRFGTMRVVCTEYGTNSTAMDRSHRSATHSRRSSIESAPTQSLMRCNAMPPLKSFWRQASSENHHESTNSAFDDIDGQAARRRFLVFLAHVIAGLAHRLDTGVERHEMLAVALDRQRCRS